MALRHLEAARQLGRRELERFAALAQSRGISRDVMLPHCRLQRARRRNSHPRTAGECGGGTRHTSAIGGRRCHSAAAAAGAAAADPPEEAVRGPRLATLQPDLIGEAAIIEALTGEPLRELEADKAVLRAYTSSGEDAARVLVRLLQDFAYPLEDETATEQEKTTARRLMGWLLNLARQVEEPEHLLPLVFALPEQTTILREPAAELTERLATVFRQEAERTDEPIGWIKAATFFNNLAVRLSALGRREEALAAAEEAVRLYRALAAARPDAFTARPRQLAQQPRQQAERSRPARGGAGRGRGSGRASTATWPPRAPTPSAPISPCRSTTSPTG